MYLVNTNGPWSVKSQPDKVVTFGYGREYSSTYAGGRPGIVFLRKVILTLAIPTASHSSC